MLLKFVKSNRFTFASLIEVRRSLLCTSRVNQLLLTDFMYFEAGVKNQNFKLGLIALKFCMGL